MWPFKSAEQRHIEETVDSIAYYVVEELRTKGLLALYLAGTILDDEERNKDSDVDIFGIVKDDFDFSLEQKINKKMLEYSSSICNGHESRFRAFTIGSLKGMNNDGVAIKWFRAERIVQRFKFFKHLWGEHYNFDKDFVKPMRLADEAFFLMAQLKENMELIRNGSEKFPVKDFPKTVIELVRVEAQLFYGFKYHPSRVKLQNHMRRFNDHIIHKAMNLRETLHSRNEIISFCDDVDKYLVYLKAKMEDPSKS